jgi:hypothetical protein
MRFPKRSAHWALVAMCVAGASLAAGCSDSPTSSSDQATVSMRGELAGSAVGMTVRKDDASRNMASSGVTADSLRISRVRVLISELKLHRDKEDTLAGDKNVKIGPMMITIDSAGARVFATGTVPPGSYDKLKFEFHRFSSSETGQYLNDTNFAAFVTNERSTFVIDGTVYNNGVAAPFEYKSDVTANLEFKFDNVLDMVAGSNTVIAVVVDPVMIFKDGRVLDPRDPANESKIDNAIKSAIKALKR